MNRDTLARAESPKKTEEVSERSRERKYHGICSTCKKAPICTYPRDPERPVLRCNEFESHGNPSVFEGESILRTSRPPVKSSAELEEDSGTYKGLCKSCLNREICPWAKREGGIWRCEEYRGL